jgi:RND family efflux transporter MFP subunit
MKKIFVFFLLFFMGENYAAAQVSYEGIIVPIHEIALAMAIDGVVKELFIKEGDFVQTGGKLLKLDDTLQGLEMERRKAIYNNNAEIQSNKENLIIIKSLLDSAKQLYEKTASVSLDEVKNLEMQYHNLQGKVNVAEAQKKQEHIEYEISKEVFARYVLTSPINGMVTAIKPEAGEWAKAGETVAVVVDASACYVDFNIAQQYARKLKKGDWISIGVDEGQGKAARKGAVVFVSSVADKASGLVKVKVEFENKNGKVIPGGLATINFEEKVH